MKRTPLIIIFLILIIILTGCESDLSVLEQNRDKHNKEVDFIVRQKLENQLSIEKFKNEVIAYLKGNTDITSIDMSKINKKTDIISILELVKEDIDIEIENRISNKAYQNSLNDITNAELVNREVIENEYFDEIRYYNFQDMQTGEIELTIIYSNGNGSSSILSIMWLEKMGYNIINKKLK